MTVKTGKVRRVLDTTHPIIGVDIGNERAKAATIINPRNTTPGDDDQHYFKTSLEVNAVIQLDKQEYEDALNRTITEPTNGLIRITETFVEDGRKIDDEGYFVVGDAALAYRSDEKQRKVKAAKYHRFYYGIQAMLSLRNIYGRNMPEAVHFVAGHPPLNDSKRQDIIDSLMGKWRLHFSEEAVNVEVKSVHVIDEITGGALNQTLRVDGLPSGNSVTKRGGDSLIFDLGGGTVDVAILNEKGLPRAGTHDSAEIGIITCIRNFKAAFDREYASLMPDSANGIPMSRVYEIFLDPEHMLRNVGGVKGGQIDCRKLFDRIVAKELNKLPGIVNDMVKGALGLIAARVFITGGAGDLLFEELSSGLFVAYANNGQIFRTAPKGQVIFANAFGMAKFGQGLRLAEQKRLRA